MKKERWHVVSASCHSRGNLGELNKGEEEAGVGALDEVCRVRMIEAFIKRGR